MPPSTLLQNLESCANDPVAVAVCFVTRVRASKVGGTVGTPGGTRGHSRLSLCSPDLQSQEFAIYTQYCNNYPRWVSREVGRGHTGVGRDLSPLPCLQLGGGTD